MGRSQINSPGMRTDFLSNGNRQAFLVHRYRNNLGPNIAKSNTGTKVSRVLHPHLAMLLEEQARQQIKRLLSSGDDDDLLRVASHTTGCTQVACNSIAQRPISTPIGLCLEPRTEVSCVSCRNVSPNLRREFVSGRVSDVCNLAGIGALWLFAEFVVRRRKTDPRETGRAEQSDLAHPVESLAPGSWIPGGLADIPVRICRRRVI
jgi:hypothetical protein